MVQMFELSLKEFYMALDECKDMCDGGPLRYNPIVGFAQMMSQQFMAMMECRLDCVKKLGEFRYNSGEYFFGSYFHYLQQGYYFCKPLKNAYLPMSMMVDCYDDTNVCKSQQRVFTDFIISSLIMLHPSYPPPSSRC